MVKYNRMVSVLIPEQEIWAIQQLSDDMARRKGYVPNTNRWGISSYLRELFREHAHKEGLKL